MLMSIFQTYYNSIFTYPQYPYYSQIVNFYSYTTPDNTINGDQSIIFGVSIYYFDARTKALYNDPTDTTIIIPFAPNVDYLNNIKYFKVKFWQLPQSSDTTNGTPTILNTNPVFVWKYSEINAPAASATNTYSYNPINVSIHDDDQDNSKTYTFNNSIINIPNRDCVINNIYYKYIRFTGVGVESSYELVQIQLYRYGVSKNAQILLTDNRFLSDRTNLLNIGSTQKVEQNNTSIEFSLLNPSKLNGYSFVSGNDLRKAISKWNIEGGFDGTNYFIIDSHTTSNYNIPLFYPSKFYQFPLMSFLSVVPNIILTQNPIHPKSFGECPINFTDQFLAKAIGINFSSWINCSS
jgi:hypothetical protein